MIKNLILIFLATALCATKCKKDSEDCHFTVPYKNNTQKSLYIITESYYPDTILRNPNPANNPQLYKVKPLSILSYKEKSCIEAIYNVYTPSDTMMFYIFDAEVLENTDWEVVKTNNMYLQRYDLSLEDLRKLNFTITYPAPPEMKDMKMWPRYEP